VRRPISSQKYLALSYVWGRASIFKTLKDNLAGLQQHGALHALWDQLPRVLQDAMYLTHYLGERYLWCDALCIVQDDAMFKHSQIALMGFIYGQAFLTICALSSADAGVGLLGFSQAAPGGLPLDVAFSTNKYAYVSTPSNLEDIIQLLPYEQRAWTFQERLLSKRCMFFTATHFYFQCQGAGMCSSDAFGKVLPYITRRRGTQDWSPLPKPSPLETVRHRDFRVNFYWTLVEKYTLRQLTYPEDVLDAFTALSSTFQEVFSCMVKKGILEMAFSCALCWAGVERLARRVPRSNESLSSSQVLPSWSWCAWEGPATFIFKDDAAIWEQFYLSYVYNFMLEEEGKVTKLQERSPVHHHKKASRTAPPLYPTGHPCMVHFMAFAVDAMHSIFPAVTCIRMAFCIVINSGDSRRPRPMNSEVLRAH
jgi:Heterokaryon incompatibility protein (HET)